MLKNRFRKFLQKTTFFILISPIWPHDTVTPSTCQQLLQFVSFPIIAWEYFHKDSPLFLAFPPTPLSQGLKLAWEENLGATTRFRSVAMSQGDPRTPWANSINAPSSGLFSTSTKPKNVLVRKFAPVDRIDFRFFSAAKIHRLWCTFFVPLDEKLFLFADSCRPPTSRTSYFHR